MDEMTLLLVVVGIVITLAIGVLLGVRLQESNLELRERRLAERQQRVTAQIRALQEHHEVNNLIWQTQNEMTQAAWRQQPGVGTSQVIEVPTPRAPGSLRSR